MNKARGCPLQQLFNLSTRAAYGLGPILRLIILETHVLDPRFGDQCVGGALSTGASA